MKIGLVSPYDFAYPSGVVGHISRLEEYMRDQGHDVTILTPSSRPEESLGRDNLIVIGRPIPIPSSGSMARIALSPRLVPKVRTVLAQEKFDIIHIHEPLMPILPLTVLRLARCPTVGTFHAFANKKRVYRYSRFLLKRWTARLDGRIAVSSPAKQFISSYFPDPYEIIPNGIDTRHFAAPQPPPPEFQDGTLNILFVGRLVEKRKGLRHLLRAYSRLKWELPNVRLIVVGPGEPDPESARLIAERGLDVVLRGMVPYEQLPAYFQAADVYCSPATGDESFGIVLLEAMAAGTPVVASNIPGYASVISNGVEGELVNPKREEEFAATLLKLLNDEPARIAMGENGRKKAQDFDWSIVADRVLSYYETVLRDTTRRPQLAASRVAS